VAVSKPTTSIQCPSSPRCPTAPAAVERILEADQIVIGPGSLFTSVLAAAAVGGSRRSGRPGLSAFTCAICVPSTPRRLDFDVSAHLEALSRHNVSVDVVLCDTAKVCPGDLGIRPWISPDGGEHSGTQSGQTGARSRKFAGIDTSEEEGPDDGAGWNHGFGRIGRNSFEQRWRAGPTSE